jgi:hypothetical protein
LARAVEESLAADRNQTETVAGGLLLSRRWAKGPAREMTTLTLVVPGEQGIPAAQHQSTLEACAIARAQHKPDEAYVVVESGKGITNPFRAQLARQGFTLNGPIEFFDRFYKVETRVGSAGRDPLKAFAAVNRHLIEQRVPQAYEVIGTGGKPTGERAEADLFTVLDEAFHAQPRGPGVHLVVGQAGGGKSILFNALYSKLFDRFQVFKRRHTAGLFPRPVFFLPEALRRSRNYSFDQLMDALFETVGAEPVSRGYMDWLHVNGHALLMFDGMDEFFARQSDLFNVLTENLLNTGSRAQVVICARDSLLATNQQLTGFLDRIAAARGAHAVHTYRLKPWDAGARRALAYLELDRRMPEAQEAEVAVRVDAFEAELAKSAALEQLAGTPFYCKLLLDEFQDGNGAPLPSDDLLLLDRAVMALLERERIKLMAREHEEMLENAKPLDEYDEDLAFPFDDFLQEDQIITLEKLRDRANLGQMTQDAVRKASAFRSELGMQGMIDLLAAAAHAFRRNQSLKVAGSGLAVETLRGLFMAHRGSAELSEDERFRAMLILQQVALFSLGPQRDTVDFTHEFLADYLAARHAARILREDPAAIAEAVGDVHVAATPVFERTLAREFQEDADLKAQVLAAASRGNGTDEFVFIRRVAAVQPPAPPAPSAPPPAEGRTKGLFKLLLGKR